MNKDKTKLWTSIAIAALALATIIASLHTTKSKSNSPTLSTIHRDIQYKTIPNVDPNLLSLDIYQTTKENAAIIIAVHGGSWAKGDKSSQMWLGHQPEYFTENGFMFVTANYRLSPTSNNMDPERIKYPIHEEDIASAIKWITEHADEYGGDKEKISLIGHSAGAGIISLLSTDKSFIENEDLNFSNIQCSILLDGDAYDVSKKARIEGEEATENNLLYQKVFATPEENKTDNTWTLASPINYLISGEYLPNFLIITRGSTSRVESSMNFMQSVITTGNEAEIIDVSDTYNHAQVNTVIGDSRDKKITPALTEFLENCR
jgi:arylformamidase